MSTIVLPWITGYATALFQLVVLAGWGLVAKLISPKVADVHHELVWPMVLIVNVLAYLLPVSPFWLLFRRRLRNVAVALIAVWLVTYLGLCLCFYPPPKGRNEPGTLS